MNLRVVAAVLLVAACRAPAPSPPAATSPTSAVPAPTTEPTVPPGGKAPAGAADPAPCDNAVAARPPLPPGWTITCGTTGQLALWGVADAATKTVVIEQRRPNASVGEWGHTVAHEVGHAWTYDGVDADLYAQTIGVDVATAHEDLAQAWACAAGWCGYGHGPYRVFTDPGAAWAEWVGYWDGCGWDDCTIDSLPAPLDPRS